jgi:hypothetical protein
MGVATLDGIPFRIDPDEVTWPFKMKVVDHKTLGGKVIQVLGTVFGDMAVTGVFGHGDPAQGDTSGWEEQERFRVRLKTFTREVAADREPTPIRFRYPPRDWDFQVYVKALSDPIVLDNETINPRYTLTLFVVTDNSGAVERGIQDLYVSRLMQGIGWKQTSYNGPSQDEVDALLTSAGAADPIAYVRAQFAAAAAGQNDNPQTPTASDGG